MGIFFVYILKSSVCLVLFYLFYRLLLSKETFHRFNRMALLGILLLSALLPLVEVTVKQETEVHQTLLTLEQLLLLADIPMVEVEAAAPVVSGMQIGMLLYLAGILFFFFRNLYSLMRMCALLSKGEIEKLENGTRLVVHGKEIAPFSWMKYIVISRKDLEENGREILIHELAHIRKKHSVDLLLADVYIFFQWFNPAAWLLKQELHSIHEYEADEYVIKQGIDAKQYQLLLIKKAVGTRLYSMANSFNHSKLKKRITMMLKEKSSPWARLKYLYVLPLAVVTVTAFARPEISEKANEISAVKVNDLAAIVETKLAETIFVSVDSVRPLPPPPAKMKKEKVSRDTLNVVVLKDVDVEVANPTIFLNSAKITSTADGKKTMVSDHQVVIGGDKVKFVDKANSMIGEAGQVTVMGAKGKIISSSLDSVLIYIDNRESTAKELEAFDASAICSVSVLKDAATITKYGTKGKNGVVLVTTQRESDKKKAIYGHMRDIQLSGKNITMHGGEELPMDMDKNSYYIDDKPSTPTEVRILMNNSSDREIVEVGSSENAEATGGYKIRIRTEKKGTSNEKIKVTGKVVDQKGAPIAGALIQVNGSTKGGTLSDKKGAFSLTVTRSARLTILAVDKAIQQSTRVSSEPMQIVLQDAK